MATITMVSAWKDDAIPEHERNPYLGLCGALIETENVYNNPVNDATYFQIQSRYNGVLFRANQK